MDKRIKLPLFLGSVCLIASAALAGVNALTYPIISQREEDARNRGYLETLNLESGAGLTMSDVQTATGDLAAAGLTGYVYFVNDDDQTLYGAVYNGETSGWEAGIKFQVGIAAGLFTGYNNIANNETSTIGGLFLTSLGDMIEGVPASDETALTDAINAYVSANVAGATANFAGVTRGAMVAALLACGVHYASLEASL